MTHAVTSKTFAQASTPSNRIVFAVTSGASGGTEYLWDSEFQVGVVPQNSQWYPPNTAPLVIKSQLKPTLIEKVILTSGSLTINGGILDPYQFVTGAGIYDFSESGGLPVVWANANSGGRNYSLALTTGNNTTALIVLRGYQTSTSN